MLNSVLYQDLGAWEESSFFARFMLGLALTAMLPILALCYFLAPNSRISELLKKPFFKFISHTVSFLWFLAMLIFSSIQDKFSDVLEFSTLGKLMDNIPSLSHFTCRRQRKILKWHARLLWAWLTPSLFGLSKVTRTFLGLNGFLEAYWC